MNKVSKGETVGGLTKVDGTPTGIIVRFITLKKARLQEVVIRLSDEGRYKGFEQLCTLYQSKGIGTLDVGT